MKPFGLARCRRIVAVAMFLLSTVAARSLGAQAAIAYRQTHERETLHEFFEFLAIPNWAADSVNSRRNVSALVAMLAKRGIAAEVLTAPGSNPAVFGEVRTPGATRTVMLYAHFDGQPTDPSQWTSPPFAPVERNGRVYARSSSDDKGSIIAMLAALDVLRAAGMKPSVNIKYFFEGGEEAGSPGLEQLLTKYKSRLQSDLILFCDGPQHQTGRPQLVYGVRGFLSVDLTVYGPIRALHDGHYGNWAPNPAVEVATLIASLRDVNGRILIDRFYDDVDPLTRSDSDALAALPTPDVALRSELSLYQTEHDNALLASRVMLPALNVRGIRAGAVGAAAPNAIDPEARVSLDFRLVPHQTPQQIQSLFETQLQRAGYTITHEEPAPEFRRDHSRVIRVDWHSGGYESFKTPLEQPIARQVYDLMRESFGAPVYRVPLLGGSLPVAIYSRVLRTPLVILPIANYDNNQHGSNENLRLDNLWSAIDLLVSLYAHL